MIAGSMIYSYFPYFRRCIISGNRTVSWKHTREWWYLNLTFRNSLLKTQPERLLYVTLTTLQRQKKNKIKWNQSYLHLQHYICFLSHSNIESCGMWSDNESFMYVILHKYFLHSFEEFASTTHQAYIKIKYVNIF